MLIGSQSEVLLKAAFSSWNDFKVGAKIDRMRDATRKMRSKEDESRRRMLAMMAGSQGSLMMKSTFSAWSECVYEGRQRREVEKMRRDMKTKGDESTKRMLGMLMTAG